MISAPPVPQHFLRVSDLGRDSLTALLDLAEAMRARPHGFVDALRGDTLVCFFEKPSTRTRVSFAAAAERLGMMPLLLRPDELQLGRGETVEDTARALSGYAAAIVVRTFEHATVEQLAGAATVPVINALTDAHHPCQALADLLTLREHFGRLEGLRVAFVGAGNNVATSLVEAGALVGMDVVVACPRGHEPSVPDVRVVPDPLEAVAGADAVYTDVWVSMGEEDEREERLARFEPYRVDAALMAAAGEDAIFMHCLPAHRGEEVTAEVIDGPQSIVWQQAENRLPTEEALVLALVARRWEP
ncbi:MAG: ornithine carbamoyltransferase [Gaiellaceae bacterium]